jgi:hypothetical protein
VHKCTDGVPFRRVTRCIALFADISDPTRLNAGFFVAAEARLLGNFGRIAPREGVFSMMVQQQTALSCRP